MFDPRPSCPVCGTVMADAALHQRFHDGLRELARVVYCPDMSPEEYAASIQEVWDQGLSPEQYEQAIREQWDRDHPAAAAGPTQAP